MLMLYTDVMTADYVFTEDENGKPLGVDLESLQKLTQSYYSDKQVASVSVDQQFSSYDEEYFVDENGDEYVRCAIITNTFADGSTDQVQWNCYM